jgi:hypothetical protein
LNIAVTEQPFYDLIGTRMMTQVDCYGRMAELMDGKPQTRCVFNPVGNLTAEHGGGLRAPAHPGKQKFRFGPRIRYGRY